jgi:hypothetical protein
MRKDPLPSPCYLSKRKAVPLCHNPIASPMRLPALSSSCAIEKFDRRKALREELPIEPIIEPYLKQTETTYPNPRRTQTALRGIGLPGGPVCLAQERRRGDTRARSRRIDGP